MTDDLYYLLKEARAIIRASSSRHLAKDWDARATAALATHRTCPEKKTQTAKNNLWQTPKP